MIKLSVEIRHWNWLLTSVLKFREIKWKTLDVLEDEIEKAKKIIYCDLWIKLGELAMEHAVIFICI
jgi:hypothetical protein